MSQGRYSHFVVARRLLSLVVVRLVLVWLRVLVEADEVEQSVLGVQVLYQINRRLGGSAAPALAVHIVTIYVIRLVVCHSIILSIVGGCRSLYRVMASQRVLHRVVSREGSQVVE